MKPISKNKYWVRTLALEYIFDVKTDEPSWAIADRLTTVHDVGGAAPMKGGTVIASPNYLQFRPHDFPYVLTPAPNSLDVYLVLMSFRR